MSIAAQVASPRPQVAKLSVRHEAILHFMLTHPTVPRRDVALQFNVTESWLSIICNSDAFNSARERLTDEIFHESVLPIREKMLVVADKALDRLNEMLPGATDMDVVRKTADSVLNSLGFSAQATADARPAAQTNIQNNFYGNASREVLLRARETIGSSDGSSRVGVERTADRGESESPPAVEMVGGAVVDASVDGLRGVSLLGADGTRNSDAREGSSPATIDGIGESVEKCGSTDESAGLRGSGPSGVGQSPQGPRAREVSAGHSATNLYDGAGRLQGEGRTTSGPVASSERPKVNLHGAHWL